MDESGGWSSGGGRRRTNRPFAMTHHSERRATFFLVSIRVAMAGAMGGSQAPDGG
jgi:hypothetical protein